MDPNQTRNHPFPNTRLSLGHNPLTLPTNNSAVNVLNSTAYPNTAVRLVDHPLPNFIPPCPNHWTANPGLLHNTYAHCSTSVNSHNFSSHHTQPGPSFFPQTTGDDLDAIDMDNRRVALKRKNPAIPIYSGSSSNLPFPAHYMQPKPISVPGPECRPSDPARVVSSNWNGNILTAGEGSQRNVRSRQNHVFPFEFNPAGSYSSSNIPQFFYSSANISGLRMPEQWNRCPVSVPPEGSNYSGNLAINGPTMIGRTYHPVQNQNMNVPVMALNGPFNQPQGIEGVNNNYAQRTGPHGAVSSYSPMGSSASTLRGSLQFETEVAAASRQPIVVGHGSSRRNGRRFMTIDQSILYNSREMLDQHRGMRLDVDNMSYEELLALGERIGYVSTGLPDELISRCLTETVCCASNKNQDDQEEGHCVICLEEYGNGDHAAKLNCGHDFHVTCIKKWLQMKNVCPICKTAASKDTDKK